MDCAYEKRVLSIIRGREGCDDKYSSVEEFKHHLNEGVLAHEKSGGGWVFWRESERQMQHQNQIITLLCHFAPEYWMDYIVQYWGVMEVEEGGQWHHYLSTSHHPFRAGKLGKGICRYRKLCTDRVYVVDMEELRGDDQEQLIGGVGRAYRNKQPESTPDLRLYSANQYPMRDEAARCGFRNYLALPLFDVHTNQCYGVLELLFRRLELQPIPHFLWDEALQVAGLRTIHSFVPHIGPRYVPRPRCDITDMLELAVKAVPRLYYAQVWIPCKQCVNMTTNSCCMKRASSHTSRPLSSSCKSTNIYDYDRACDFHNNLLDLRSFSSSLCDLNISKNPLAHYAQRCGMYHPFAISLQSLDDPNLLYLLVFFFQSKFREDAYVGDDSLHLLLGMIEVNLMKSFKFEPELLLLKEILVQSRQPNAVECGSIDSLDAIYSYKQFLSESNFMACLETVDSCCLRPSLENHSEGWVFCWSGGETLPENNVHRNPLLVPVVIKEKLKTFMKNIALNNCTGYWIIQFWAPTLVGDRRYLRTWNQPYAVGCLAKGIASFRKKCMRHSYYVDDKAKDDELGPPGRVFRNGHIEISPDLSCYTRDEFPVRNYAMHCCSRGGYFALPILDDEHNHMTVGVLEFIGFSYTHLEMFGTELKAAKLCSTHVGMQPRFLEQPDNSMFRLDQALSCKKAALAELCNTLRLINRHNIPQLHVANVWVPNEECVTSAATDMCCLEVVLSTTCYKDFKPAYQVNWIHVQNRKGMVGMVLASENKSCFCRNLSEFGIADQPLSHYQMSDRCDVCFAICLLSSHTGDLLYVLEFLLDQGPPTYEYLLSFLNFLLPIMKHELKSFKMASGKQLGEELVVEMITFSDANVLDFSGSEEENMFPIQFKSVKYIQKEHQHTQEQHIEECSVVASCSKARPKGKRKTSPNLSLEVLKSHFGKKLKDVAEELGVGKSTIKRACRGYGIDRWPCNKKDASRLTKECGEASRQDMLPSSSNIQPLDASLHLNAPHTTTEEKVTVKVKYMGDIIKFELYLSLGLGKLKEAVAERINLEMGTYKLKYKDEDGDEILLANDDDLQLCRKSQITIGGRSYIELIVRN